MRINGTAADDSSPLVFRAFAAHHRACARQRAVHEVPSAAGSFWCELGGLEYVVLRSDDGRVLRVYRVRTSGLLKELRRWPRELEDAPRPEAAPARPVNRFPPRFPEALRPILPRCVPAGSGDTRRLLRRRQRPASARPGPVPGRRGRCWCSTRRGNDPKWIIATVSVSSDVRAAEMEPGGLRYAGWPVVMQWVRGRIGQRVRLVPISATV